MIPLKCYFLPACKYTSRIIQPDNTSNHLNILCPGVSANLTGMPKYSSLSMIGEGQLWTGFIVFPIPNFIQTAPCKNLTNVIPPKRNTWMKRTSMIIAVHLMLLLMEEIPNNHLGCIKPGKETTKLNWWSPDFWTINSSTLPCIPIPQKEKGKTWGIHTWP